MADDVVAEKQCGRCGEIKPLTEYSIVNRTKTKPEGNPHNLCHPCKAAYSREWRAKKAEAPPKPITVIEKSCKDCSQILPADQFSKNRQTADGLNYVCKACDAIFRKKWEAANPDKVKEKRKRDKDIMRRKRREPKVEVDVKTCRECRVEKASSEFHRNLDYPDGRDNLCADCANKYRTERRKLVTYEVSVSEKRCCMCKEIRSSACFSIRTSSKDGLASNCKACQAEYTKQWRSDNADTIKKTKAADYAANRDEHKAKARAWARANVLRKSMMDREWRLKNADRKRENDRRYREENREDVLAKKRIWCRRFYIEVKKKDPGRMLHMRMSSSIRRGLSGKGGRSWQDLVPYTKEQLLKRLQQTMPEGYTWDDFLSGILHIDHIIPVSAFNFKEHTDRDFQLCWQLSNLQLLPQKDNLEKGRKISKPFQPSFAGI